MIRRPFVFSVVLLVALLALTLVARILLPAAPIGDVSGLSSEALEPPSLLEQSITALKNADNLFWVLALALAAVVLTLLGWWHEAGFRRLRWRKLYLILFPLAVCAFALSHAARAPAKSLPERSNAPASEFRERARQCERQRLVSYFLLNELAERALDIGVAGLFRGCFHKSMFVVPAIYI